jgi:hypothetical protein
MNDDTLNKEIKKAAIETKAFLFFKMAQYAKNIKLAIKTKGKANPKKANGQKI